MSSFVPSFTITNSISRTLSGIDQEKGFLDAVTLSENWLNQMRQRALILGVRGGKASPGKYRRIQNYIINSFTG